MVYQDSHEEQENLSSSEYSLGKPEPHPRIRRTSQNDIFDAKRTKAIRSTLKLKLNVLFCSIFSLGLTCLAGMQSWKHFVTLGYAPLGTFNSQAAKINAVVAVYGAITGMATRYAVVKSLNLLSIKALTTGGRFMWSAKTWAYMSHANGPWYTLMPLFIAGLAATAVISVLPISVVDSGHYIHLELTPSLEKTEIDCWTGQYLTPDTFCTGASIAAMLLQSYSVQSVGYARNGQGPQLMLDGQISSNRSLGYPWELVNNTLAEMTKYRIAGGPFQQSNKTACAWVLDQVPMRCSFLNYTVVDGQQVVLSPYSNQRYFFQDTASEPQNMRPTSLPWSGMYEIPAVGRFSDHITEGQGVCNAFVCTTRELSDVHVGRYIASEAGIVSTQVDLANDSSCQPTYDLPSTEDLFHIACDLAGGLFQFDSVDGSNTLIESFSQGNFKNGMPMFGDSQSQFEDGMGSFMALMLSHLYAASNYDSPGMPNVTRVDGGYKISTVGLDRGSLLYIWLVLAITPLLALVAAICVPLDYVPSWDVMNPMDALATEAIIDEDLAAAYGRTSGIRLGIVDGRIVASNTNLPTRISRGNAS